VTVSKDGGTWPHWSRDGKELFYVGPDGKVMAVEVTTNPIFQTKVPQGPLPSAVEPGRRGRSRRRQAVSPGRAGGQERECAVHGGAELDRRFEQEMNADRASQVVFIAIPPNKVGFPVRLTYLGRTSNEVTIAVQ
jgi:hypothetical protein